MRSMIAALALVSLGIAASGCGADEPDEPEATGTATTAAPPGGAEQMASCLVGQ